MFCVGTVHLSAKKCRKVLMNVVAETRATCTFSSVTVQIQDIGGRGDPASYSYTYMIPSLFKANFARRPCYKFKTSWNQALHPKTSDLKFPTPEGQMQVSTSTPKIYK
eukprot:3446500-Amphidinium_carterae.1